MDALIDPHRGARACSTCHHAPGPDALPPACRVAIADDPSARGR